MMILIYILQFATFKLCLHFYYRYHCFRADNLNLKEKHNIKIVIGLKKIQFKNVTLYNDRKRSISEIKKLKPELKITTPLRKT